MTDTAPPWRDRTESLHLDLLTAGVLIGRGDADDSDHALLTAYKHGLGMGVALAAAVACLAVVAWAVWGAV